MLKKTTIYLEESDIDRLKALSLLTKSSMTDLIRRGIAAYYTTLDADQKVALKAFEKISLPLKKNSSSERKTKKRE